MHDQLLRMCGLTKEQVQAMMTSQKKHPSRNASFINDKPSRLKFAYEMIASGVKIEKAAMSWCVSVNDITMYAKKNKLTAPLDMPGVIPISKSYKAWSLSRAIGVSKAAREIGVSRRAIYAFAQRYNLTTPYQK